MKKVFIIIAMFYGLIANAQDYLITFAGTGASSSVNNVTVENLTTGTSLTLSGNDILHLKGLITGIDQTENAKLSGMKIYPNPMVDNSTVEFFPPVAGDAIIAVYDMAGKQVTRVQSYLENNRQEFKLSGNINGIYLLSVTGYNYKFSQKLICNGKSNGTLSIRKSSNNIQTVQEQVSKTGLKGVLSTVDMQYSSGDRIKLTGVSGIYTTIIIDIPATSKLVTFTFVACTDGEGNNYPVVQIGTGKSAPQVWMASNLKSTKFNDGTEIPLVTDKTAWSNLNSSGYCWYNNNPESYKASYGALYNWYTVSTGKLCPAGWHVPAFAEWTKLTDFLGGSNAAGGKLKETGTLHWLSPNKGATNETGFTALPGGYRSSDGTFDLIGSFCKLWLGTGSDIANAFCQFINNNSSNVDLGTLNKKSGLSVRCIKD